MDVTEHITVRAEGNNIQRGIYRDFPTRYRDRHGNQMIVGFDVLGVERNGVAEPWLTMNKNNGVRVKVGGDDYLPVSAEYTYTLRYRTTRQLGFFADNDELYWNAIGQGWALPIDRGSVEVHLPQPVPLMLMRARGYSGRFGARNKDFIMSLPKPGSARWVLTQPLKPQEGLTIVLSFPKGIVAAPTRQQQLHWLLRDNIGVLFALAGLLSMSVFCLLRWRKVGRSPASGTVIVRYHPPPNHSPAGLRYLMQMQYDKRCFSADLLAAAVDGAVLIEREQHFLKDSWKLQLTGADAASTTAEQRELLQALFVGGADELKLDNSNASTIKAALGVHEQILFKRCQPALFTRNVGSITIAIAIAVLASLGAFAASGGSGIPLILLCCALMLAVLVTFAKLIKTPTVAGRKLMDEVEGFKRYLVVADREELARLPAPDTAPPALDASRYEQLLPYAVALDVEDAWTKKFTLAVGAAAAAQATATIHWYHCGGSGDPGSFTSSIGSNLSSQISSASNSQISSAPSSPGSSSGGGGGGFSGGGGGVVVAVAVAAVIKTVLADCSINAHHVKTAHLIFVDTDKTGLLSSGNKTAGNTGAAGAVVAERCSEAW